LERPDTASTKLQISPLIVNGFENGFHKWIQHIFVVVVEAERIFFRKIFFCFQNLDALYEKKILQGSAVTQTMLSGLTVNRLNGISCSACLPKITKIG